ncbi:phosphoenolpyruvate--protein phosphotransferase [Thalassobaculum sp.]|uniref:phosphoenolpyruvate--protein phosphotransferase n=1 Tax=Thalassobaculum sp. TaxID=2022740 RepID=UPI0032EF982A
MNAPTGTRDTGPGGGPREMLRRLRDVMAGIGTPQQRLDSTVQVIAHELGAEVCSIYVQRPGRVLELCATQGLNPQAVHRLFFQPGEGLVGHIAETRLPLTLAEAQKHPKFAYRPETGEEAFQSFAGVPIRRSDRVLGVLVVQHVSMRELTEEEVESLETLAMVLAEVLATMSLPGGDPGRERGPVLIHGMRIHEGIGVGKARLHQPRVVIGGVVAEDPAVEHELLRAALADMHESLDRVMESEALSAAGEHRDVLETYRLIARDTGWIGRIRDAIDGGLTAAASVQKVRDDTRSRMAAVKDEYLRERLADFEDVALRLLRRLAPGEEVGVDPAVDAEPFILVARSMGPAELLDYAGEHLKGLVLEEASATAHVGIVARALDIPVIGRLAHLIDEVDPGDTLIVDGDHGQVFVRPGDDARSQFRENLAAREATRARYAALRDTPAVSRDGVRVSLLMNAGLLVDVSQLETVGAEGVGLYRTEIPFLVRREYPDVEAQTELYGRILEGAGGRPVTFRTLDAGGDKRLHSFVHDIEENPALGWRALRIGLDQPAILRQQVRAMIHAAGARPLRVMLPMVATVEEFRAARSIIDLEVERAAARTGGARPAIAVGAMVEVPTALLQIEALAEAADFLSVGSNDLLQFLFAADRGGERTAARYDPLSVLFLDAMRRIAEAGRSAGIDVSVCGEMAGRPLEALALTALGYRSLSMPAASIGPVKEAILRTDINGLSEFISYSMKKSTSSVRNRLQNYLTDRR